MYSVHCTVYSVHYKEDPVNCVQIKMYCNKQNIWFNTMFVYNFDALTCYIVVRIHSSLRKYVFWAENFRIVDIEINAEFSL